MFYVSDVLQRTQNDLYIIYGCDDFIISRKLTFLANRCENIYESLDLENSNHPGVSKIPKLNSSCFCFTGYIQNFPLIIKAVYDPENSSHRRMCCSGSFLVYLKSMSQISIQSTYFQIFNVCTYKYFLHFAYVNFLLNVSEHKLLT